MTLSTLLTALLEGGAVSLVAVAVVVVHRATGVVNLAAPALGGVGFVLTFRLAAFTPLGFGPGLVVGLVVGAGVGAVAGLLVQRFRPHGQAVTTVATLALSSPLLLLAANVDGLPFFPVANERTTAQLELLSRPAGLLPLSDQTVEVGSLGVPFGLRHLVAAELVVVALAGLVWLLRRGWGTRLDTAAAGPGVAGGAGVETGRVAVTAWAVAGALTTMGAVAHGLVTAAVTPSPLVIDWVVGLVLVGLRRPLLAGASTVAFTVSVAIWEAQGWNVAWLLLAGVVGLTVWLVVRPADGEDPSSGVDPWRTRRRVPTGAPRPVLAAVAGTVLVALMVVLPIERAFELGIVLAAAPLVAAFVVTNGWAGIPTFALMAWMATGALVTTALAGGPLGFWGAAAIALAASGVVAVALDAAQLRRPGPRGLLLSFVASAAGAALVARLLPGLGRVPRPRLLLFDLADDRVFGVAVVLVVLGMALGLARLNQSRLGRRFLLVREDPGLLASLGRSAVRIRAVALALGGVLGGLGGVLTVTTTGVVDLAEFDLLAVVAAALAAALGGLTAISAMFTGPAWLLAVPMWVTSPLLTDFLRLGGTLLLLYLAPAGLAQVGRSAADGASRLRGLVRRRNHDRPAVPVVAELATSPALATGAWADTRSIHHRGTRQGRQ